MNILLTALAAPLVDLTESFIDKVIRDTVDTPIPGSVVYCDLAFGYADHSGIYIGIGQIVHLNSRGNIEIVSPEEFMEGTTAMSIYVSCRGGKPVGSRQVANRAISMIGSSRDYNFVFDNCHQFVAGCLSGNFNNSSNFLWMLKDETRKVLRGDSWRVLKN